MKKCLNIIMLVAIMLSFSLSPPFIREGLGEGRTSTPPQPSPYKREGVKVDDYQFYLKSGDKSPKWDEYIEPAFQSFDGGNFSTAYVFLNKAYGQGCRDGLVLFRLGIYKESQKKYKEAAEYLRLAAEKLPKQYPSHPLAKSVHEHAGRVLYLVNDYEHALPELKLAIEVSPNNFMALFMAGQILRMQNKIPPTPLLQSGSENSSPPLTKGGGEDLTKAREYLERALAAPVPEGTSPDAKLNVMVELMTVTFELKDFDASIIYADKILSVIPGDPRANAMRNRVNTHKQKLQEKRMLEEIVK